MERYFIQNHAGAFNTQKDVKFRIHIQMFKLCPEDKLCVQEIF